MEEQGAGYPSSSMLKEVPTAWRNVTRQSLNETAQVSDDIPTTTCDAMQAFPKEAAKTTYDDVDENIQEYLLKDDRSRERERNRNRDKEHRQLLQEKEFRQSQPRKSNRDLRPSKRGGRLKGGEKGDDADEAQDDPHETESEKDKQDADAEEAYPPLKLQTTLVAYLHKADAEEAYRLLKLNQKFQKQYPNKKAVNENIQALAAYLRNLQPKNRPSTPAKLRAVIARSKGFHSVRVYHLVTPNSLVHAMLPLVASAPALSKMLKSFAIVWPRGHAAVDAAWHKELVNAAAARAVHILRKLTPSLAEKSIYEQGQWLCSQACAICGDPALILSELCTRRILSMTEDEKLVYHEDKLKAVPKPLAQEQWQLSKSADFTKPDNTEFLQVPLGHGFIANMRKAKLFHGLELRTDEWRTEALSALGIRASLIQVSKINASFKRSLRKGASRQYQTLELRIATSGHRATVVCFRDKVRDAVKKCIKLNLRWFEVRDCCFTSSFFGTGGSRLELLRNWLHCGLECQRDQGIVKVVMNPETPLSEEHLRKVIQLLCGKNEAHEIEGIDRMIQNKNKTIVPNDRIGWFIGKGGRRIRYLETKHKVILSMEKDVDGCRILLWPTVEAMDREYSEERALCERKERACREVERLIREREERQQDQHLGQWEREWRRREREQQGLEQQEQEQQEQERQKREQREWSRVIAVLVDHATKAKEEIHRVIVQKLAADAEEWWWRETEYPENDQQMSAQLARRSTTHTPSSCAPCSCGSCGSY